MYSHISRERCVEAIKSDSTHSEALMWRGKPETVDLHWLDDTLVGSNLALYGEALRKVYPFVQFMPHPFSSSWEYYQNTSFGVDMLRRLRRYSRVCVFIPDARFSLADIGYGKFGVKAAGEFTYMTCARGINNRGCAENLEQASMLKTTRLSKAVQNVLKHLVGYSTKEIAKLEYHKLASDSGEAGAKKAVVLPTLLKTITDAVLINEVRALKAAGVTFTTVEFNNVAQQCDDAVRLANEERQKRVDATLVRFIRTPGGATEIECYETRDIRRRVWDGGGEVFRHTTETLPSFMTEKIAVLQMMIDGDHVDGVGAKLDALTYWVEK